MFHKTESDALGFLQRKCKFAFVDGELDKAFMGMLGDVVVGRSSLRLCLT